MSTTQNEKNEVGNISSSQSSSSQNGKEILGNQVYIPPGRRQRLIEQERSQKSNNHYNNSSRNDRRENNHFSSNNAFQKREYSENNIFSNSNSYNKSNRGQSKWKSSQSYQYGSDGLLPRNIDLENELFKKSSNTGINFDKYKEIPVEAFGTDVPPCITNFTDLDIGPVLRNSIELCNYTVPTPVQQYALPIIFEKRDLMACAQTGSGKTAAFLFPTIAVMLKDKNLEDNSFRGYNSRVAYPNALILAPTRELASQIYEEARKFTYRSHLRPVVVYGGTNFQQQSYDLRRGCHILVATPGRLYDMIENNLISLERVKYLCLDEADRMLDMGFEKQIRYIVSESGMPDVADRQTLMFSATFPQNIQRLASDFLNDYIFLKVGRVGSTNDFIVQHILYVEEEDKKAELIKTIDSIEGLTLVFVERKKSVDIIQDFLYDAGYPTASIHGDKSQREREYALESFRNGKTPILVATDVAARGLDIFNVAHVINFDMPNDINDYVHRIGRTGRAGNNGLATAFFNENNRNVAKSLIEILEQAAQEVPTFLSRINSDMNRFGGKSKFKRNGNGFFNGGGNNYRKYNHSSTSDYRYDRESSSNNGHHREQTSNGWGNYGYGGHGNGYGGNYG